jgi:SPOR domain
MKKKSAENRQKQQKSSRLQNKTVKWAVAGFLISLWMFVLGLLVGRGTAPVKFDIHKLQKELAGLKKATIDKTTQRYKIAFEELDKKAGLGFHEALTDSTLNLQAPPPPAVAENQAQGPGSSDSETKIRRKVRDDIFKKKKPSLPGTVIQVVATKDENHADKLVAKLKTLGYHAYRTTGTIPGKGTWYRVRVDGFKTPNEAKAAMNQLKSERFSPIFIRK